jgi:AcrR family transcriptional regulator
MMAHRAARKSASQSAKRPARKARAAAANASGDTVSAELPVRDKIVAALMELLTEEPFEEIELGDVAASAGVTLAQLRGEFSSTIGILAAFMTSIDRAVLAQDYSDMAEEPARERLFDVEMRRLEALAPHRAAIRSLLRSARRHPPLALTLGALSARSQRWMLAAAGIGAAGPRGFIRARGLTAIFAAVLRTWVRDDDPTLARTMAELDRALGRGERLIEFFHDITRIPRALCRLRPRRRYRRDNEPGTQDGEDGYGEEGYSEGAPA